MPIKRIIKMSLEYLRLLGLMRQSMLKLGMFTESIKIKFLVPFFSKNRFLSGIYYIFSPQFRRENLAILQGRYANFMEGEISKKSSYDFSRYIHRLEKGISMRDRKKVFALDYIGQILEYYKNIAAEFNGGNKTISYNRLKWGHDVLEHYFEITKDAEQVKEYKKIFDGIRFEEQPGINAKKLIPYRRRTAILSSIDYKMFLGLARQRRSVRWFLPKSVPRELIDKAIEIAELSPSDCNRSPCEFLVFDDSKAAAEIASIPKGTRGFAENIPATIVVVGKLNAYPNEANRHGIYIDTGLASMSLMFSLETLGLASCPINWPDVESMEKKMSQILHLKPYERVTMLIGVGYPDPEGLIPYSAKKEIEHIRKYLPN